MSFKYLKNSILCVIKDRYCKLKDRKSKYRDRYCKLKDRNYK